MTEALEYMKNLCCLSVCALALRRAVQWLAVRDTCACWVILSDSNHGASHFVTCSSRRQNDDTRDLLSCVEHKTSRQSPITLDL